MGAPACDYFCENGHHVDGCGHHEIMFDLPKECPICGSKKLANQIEWGDNGYDQIVPQNPISYQRRVVRIEKAIDKNGNPIEAYLPQSIPVYDVKKLFEEKVE